MALQSVTYNAKFESDYESKTVTFTINVDNAEWDCPKEAGIFHIACNIIGTEGFERETWVFVPRFLEIYRVKDLSDLGLS